MLRQYKIPLYFLAIGSLLGMFLRWQFILPTAGTNYSFFLHGHSHIMFLGWISNVLYIGFVNNHIEEKDQRFYKRLFWVLQFLVIGMLISFPLQGYGFYSILFSTLHTVGVILFTIVFLLHTKKLRSTSIWYARAGLIFFVISTAGPFSLGYLMASGMGSSHWYNLSIYFYLHFQYNGFFFFGILSLFFGLLEGKHIVFSGAAVVRAGWIFAAMCLPAYLLSTLWVKSDYVFNIIGGLSAVGQCIAFLMLLKTLFVIYEEIMRKFVSASRILLTFALAGLTLKLFLQVVSAFPFAAEMAYELRPVVIAYLHLVLAGLVSASLFIWYVEHNFIDVNRAKAAIVIFITSFTGMEITLTLTPWWSSQHVLPVFTSAEYCFVFSSLLAVSYFLFLIGTFNRKTDKNQYFN